MAIFLKQMVQEEVRERSSGDQQEALPPAQRRSRKRVENPSLEKHPRQRGVEEGEGEAEEEHVVEGVVN